MKRASPWARLVAEPAALAIESLRTERARSALAIGGIVIGIVTVVLVASSSPTCATRWRCCFAISAPRTCSPFI